MILTPDDLQRIAARTLSHYDKQSQSYWEGTRDHDVSQNVDALLRSIEAPPPFELLDLGCGPGRDLKTFTALGHPELIGALSEAFYVALAPMANRWPEAMGVTVRFPDQHSEFIARCHAAGQRRPTPLLLKYGAGDYNCLHQDLYGEHVFPLQVVLLLSEPGRDFEGGEFVLTEQRPRMHSRAMVLPVRQGDAAVIAVRHQPVQGTQGSYRVNLRHGVSQVRSGQRYTAGFIFHGAT